MDANKPQTKTTPFSGVTRAMVTPARVEACREIARARGDKQFGFRNSKADPMHTIIVTDGGTIDNPSGGRSDIGGAS